MDIAEAQDLLFGPEDNVPPPDRSIELAGKLEALFRDVGLPAAVRNVRYDGFTVLEVNANDLLRVLSTVPFPTTRNGLQRSIR